MPKILLFCVIFFYAITGWPADYHRTVKWFQQPQNADLKNKSESGFEGSIIIDRTGLPYWFESFDLNSSGADVTITNAVFEPILHPSAGLVDYQKSELQFKSDIGVSAGKSILRLTIFPFIRRNDRIERLVEFTIGIKENSNQLKSAGLAYQWKSTSILGSGKWIKIKTKSKGIFKITFDQLKQWGFSNPDQVSMYGNGGLMLPVMNKDIQTDDLNPYPVWKGQDNANKDCLFFYSSGNISFKQDLVTGTLTHQQNYYSTETFFYLSDQGNLRSIDKVAAITEVAGKQVFSFPNYTFYEKEALNLISSGSQWFGERFIPGGSQSINLVLDNPDLTKPAHFVIPAVGKSTALSNMDVYLNGKLVDNMVFKAVNNSDPTSIFADDQVAEFTENLPAKNIQVKLTYNVTNTSTTNTTGDAWLDYIAVNYTSNLNMITDFYSFRGKGVDGQISISEYVLNGASASTKIFDVTDFSNTFEMPATFANGQLKFKSNSTSYREYIAFNPGGSIPAPDLVGTVANQNLHSADLSEMIIVSNQKLKSAADTLASFHRRSDQMTVQVVTPEVIYNEFSGGLPDPSGIRNYFRMCYDLGMQSGKNTLKYILLMGDGSYDNRNILGKSHNLIPTYESENSLAPTESFVTDDFYVFLDASEGGSQGTVDLGIGRIPAYSKEDAASVVDKIMNYNTHESMGNWRDVVTFIADDGNKADGFTNVHMEQAEGMANFLNTAYPAFFTDKIYFDAFKRISTAGGEKYPDVTDAINSRVKQGTLVMNYTGHANERDLADEIVFDIGNINSLSNYTRLPIFVTATCEYSRFDADETSAGEYFLFNPRGGAIGLFSTTRLVYSGANSILNGKVFNYIFQKDTQWKNLRLGDVMRLAKAAANTGTNQLNFSLLADPALRLAIPNYQVKTTSVDGKNTDSVVDTIKTLSVITVKGYVADNNGVKLSTFNGEIIPTVYDKAMQVKTLGNAGQDPFSYVVQNNVIYKGLASVKNGEFEFSFFVPKDVSFKLDKGKILYYAYNESIDAQGYFDGFYIGGSSNAAISDSNGPQIDLFMNSVSFKDGETVSASSVLLANISDETGINTSGTGIGHDIIAILDNNYLNIMVLNDYFQADKDNYKTGKIVFPLTGLAEGEHTLKLKVWDVLNNSSEKEIHFFVKDVFRIETVNCYPNPTQGQTQFVFTHNQPDETFDVSLEVFETTGSRVDLLQATIGSSGTESVPLVWIPANRKVKMKPGIYIYRLSVTTKDGKMSSGSGRLVFVYR
ncbi:MAG TPA: type IX secretion system sortase PorU [Prolixibacteraceae bacterium]